MSNNFNLRTFLSENKLTSNSKVLNEASYSDSYESDAAKKAISKIKSAKSPDTAAVDQMIALAEKETGTKVSDLERRVLHRQANWINTQDSEMERESVEPSLAEVETAPQLENEVVTQEESIQSARDRRIVEMVQRALGVGAPVSEVEISEDEMVQENPLPKYESIDELMKEIEHGTNEAAHKYKMDKMKSVYEALETKVGSLEEGEHAEHINPKDIKQMRKDIAALRKAEEKLRKEYDKKFAVKEKPAKKEAE